MPGQGGSWRWVQRSWPGSVAAFSAFSDTDDYCAAGDREGASDVLAAGGMGGCLVRRDGLARRPVLALLQPGRAGAGRPRRPARRSASVRGGAARIALEPGTNKYYAAGAVVGALVWDLVGSAARFPWWTAGAVGALFASRWLPMPDAAHGWITLAYCVACAAVLLPGRGGQPPNGRCLRLSLSI